MPQPFPMDSRVRYPSDVGLASQPGPAQSLRILGQDFLEHFDMLIDNAHNLLCLDNSGALRANVRGPRTALVTPPEVADDSQRSNLIIVEARLSDATRPVRLMLDSGANGAVLYNTAEYLEPPRRGSIHGTSVDGRQRMFSVLPLQDLKIGSVKLTGVPFFSLSGNEKDARNKGFDGILSLGLFRRVFIAPADAYAVLEPDNKEEAVRGQGDVNTIPPLFHVLNGRPLVHYPSSDRSTVRALSTTSGMGSMPIRSWTADRIRCLQPG